jgi:AmmeMemoRadiSam system protein A
LDHGATVPLWFLAAAGWRGPTVVVGLNYPGEPGRQELGAAIRAAAMRAERRVGIIASGDMSHCLRPGAPAGFHPRAKEFDAAFIGILRAGRYRDLLDFDGELQLLAAEDALDATVIAAAAVNWDATGHKVLSYEGPFGVGYGVALLHASLPERDSVGALQAATRERTDPSGGSHLPEIARQSIEAAFGRKVTLPTATAGILAEAHGVFVTIRDQAGNLRGCVGTVTPHCANTAAETWRLAREAAFHDGRFRPMRSAELADVRFEVSVICSLEEVAAEELDPQGYGVSLLTPDGRHGVLLPALAGVETVAQQLAIARRKGGIAPDEPVQTRRFTVKKFCERQPAEHPHECHSG